MAVLDKITPTPSRGQATGLSLTSWVLFASSGPVAKAVLATGWSPGAVTSVRIALAAVLPVPAAQLAGAVVLLAGAVLVQLAGQKPVPDGPDLVQP